MIVYRELSSLVCDLGISARTLYYLSNTLYTHYHKTELPKKDGGKRVLRVPDKLLKAVQKRINAVLLPLEEVSEYAYAYLPGASPYLNAIKHAGAEKILKLDIRHFFDNVTYGMVKEKVFTAERYSEANRILLSILCTYDDTLPQGAPTSPAISNILMKDFDDEVGTWCRNRGIAYTRYCDDMTFSGHFDHAEVRKYVSGALRKQGFFLNDHKTVTAHKGQKMEVTGLTISDKVQTSVRYRHDIRQQLYYCRKYGIEEHLRRIGSDETREHFVNRMLGRISFVLSADGENKEMKEYRKWLLNHREK